MPSQSIQKKMMLVVATTAVCFAIITPIGGWIALQRGLGRLAGCESNMKNTVLGLLGYLTTKGSFPSGTVPGANLPPEDRLSFYVPVSPYLDQCGLIDYMDPSQRWDRGTNASLVGTRIGILICSSSTRVAEPAPQPTTVIGIAGIGADAPSLPKTDPRAGVFGYDRMTTVADIKDGTSVTMMLAESGRVIGSWSRGGPATVRGLDPTDVPYIGTGRQFGGLHDGVVVVAMADGSVRAVSETINPKVFEALSTIAGGEQVPGESEEQQAAK